MSRDADEPAAHVPDATGDVRAEPPHRDTADRAADAPPPSARPLEGETGLGRTLRFLVCVGGGQESEETLRFGVRVVKALGGDLTILYVARPVPQSVRDEVLMTQQKLSEWDTDLPGMSVLRYARDLLRESDILLLDPEGTPGVILPLQAMVTGGFEMQFSGTYGSVHFRVREGEIAEEIRRETRAHPYDLLIIGAGTNKRLQHNLAQFSETSILFVKNVRPVRYRLLVCTGGEPAGLGLAQFTARVAAALKMAVTVLSVDDLRQTRQEAERWVAQIARIFESQGIDTRTVVRKGKIVKTIVETAGEDHVIVIGKSNVPEIKQFFFGSRPIKVVQEARCPVLHVI